MLVYSRGYLVPSRKVAIVRHVVVFYRGKGGYYTLKKVKYIMKQELDLFHQIALEQYIRAMMIGKHNDSEYVKLKTYEAYEWELKKK